jgi:hypothetical protein
LRHHDRWRLTFEFADRQSAFHRAGIVGCRRRLGRPQLGWARSQSVDDLARASRRHRLDVPLRLPPILGSAPRRSQPSSQCKTSAPIVARVTATASARDGKAVAAAKKAVPLRGEAPGAKARQCPPSPVSSLVSVVPRQCRPSSGSSPRIGAGEAPEMTAPSVQSNAHASICAMGRRLRPGAKPFRNPGGVTLGGRRSQPAEGGWPRGQKLRTSGRTASF